MVSCLLQSNSWTTSENHVAMLNRKEVIGHVAIYCARPTSQRLQQIAMRLSQESTYNYNLFIRESCSSSIATIITRIVWGINSQTKAEKKFSKFRNWDGKEGINTLCLAETFWRIHGHARRWQHIPKSTIALENIAKTSIWQRIITLFS